MLRLSIATTDYDHFRDLRFGLVKAEGIELTWLNLGHHECFARFTANREFDLSELSLAKFSTQVTREASDIIGLPVVCSRLFRFSSFYVNRKSGIKSVKDLRGKKVGSPEWAHSAAVYMRGWMHNDMGVKLQDVHWYQAGANAPGRRRRPDGSTRRPGPPGSPSRRSTWWRRVLPIRPCGRPSPSGRVCRPRARTWAGSFADTASGAGPDTMATPRGRAGAFHRGRAIRRQGDTTWH